MIRNILSGDHRRFILAGNSTFTIENELTEVRFTFKVKKLKDEKKLSVGQKDMWFASVLTGSDNEESYTFLGSLSLGTHDQIWYKHSKKCPYLSDNQKVRTLIWLLKNLGKFPPNIKLYHEGKCGKCGRKLTVPSSILSGFGPSCVKLRNQKC